MNQLTAQPRQKVWPHGRFTGWREAQSCGSQRTRNAHTPRGRPRACMVRRTVSRRARRRAGRPTGGSPARGRALGGAARPRGQPWDTECRTTRSMLSIFECRARTATEYSVRVHRGALRNRQLSARRSRRRLTQRLSSLTQLLPAFRRLHTCAASKHCDERLLEQRTRCRRARPPPSPSATLSKHTLCRFSNGQRRYASCTGRSKRGVSLGRGSPLGRAAERLAPPREASRDGTHSGRGARIGDFAARTFQRRGCVLVRAVHRGLRPAARLQSPRLPGG